MRSHQPRSSDRSAGPRAPGRPERPWEGRILDLQRQAGNAAVVQLLGEPVQRQAAFARRYGKLDVKALLDASQGRAGSTGAVGHVREHVRDGAGTLAYAKAEQKLKTCYVNNSQQEEAVRDALNSTTGQSQLASLDSDVTKKRVVISNVVTGAYNAWQAEATSARARKIRVSAATVIVDRLPALAAGTPHVQTAYPVG